MQLRRGVAVGLAAAVLLIALTTPRLTAQGLYYDELHQAPASFYYIGKPPEYFVCYRLGGVPLLNMTYSGAIKSALYGAYMRLSGRPFTVTSWRLTGIVFTAVGILGFSVMAARCLPSGALTCFLILLITDGSVLLMTRHDWGPVSLALLLRLLLAGIWMTDELDEAPRPRRSFFMGLLVGLAVFEKLSSAVLLPALAVILARRSKRCVGAAVAGLLVGSLPLLVINTSSLLWSHRLISLSAPPPAHAPTLPGFPRYLYQYLHLGDGSRVRTFILGPSGAAPAEFLLILLYAAIAVAGPPASRVALACYAVVCVSTYLIPYVGIEVHHWIIGTPFQYAAIALALTTSQSRRLRSLFLAVGILLLASRLAGLASLEAALLRGEATFTWDASLTAAGEFAAEHAERAVFIVADYGVALPVYCLTQGRPNTTFELFWSYQGPQQLEEVLARPELDSFYLLKRTPVPPYDAVNADATSRILNDAAALPGWREVEALRLTTVGVRRFVRSGGR